jgi:hypothetical protein
MKPGKLKEEKNKNLGEEEIQPRAHARIGHCWYDPICRQLKFVPI